jgi:hypothetical protein
VTTGLELSYTDCRSGGVLLLGVDGVAYAMSYGSGYLQIPDALKDQRFGLRFLIRRLDSDQVRDLVRRRPDARGRTDSTLVVAGAPVWTLGIAENVEIIRRIGGKAKDLKVTFSSRTSRDEISSLFPVTPSVELPAWSLPAKRTEYDYNRSVAARYKGKYMCLDRNQSVRDPLGARSSLEICDLLGPNNELIHVKRAAGSAPLSHLFFQGLISAQSLITGPPSVRERFVATVAGLLDGRVLPPDFKPTKVIYAILMENGKQLTPDTLFPFSQATLAHAARILSTYGVEVEVIGILTAQVS